MLVERLKTNLLSGSEGTIAGKSHSALVFAELLGLLNGQLHDYDDALELARTKHPDAHIFRSFPGVGLITASTLLAELGEDRDYYPHVGMVLAEAGLAPVTRSSGRPHHVGFRYAANSRLREACTWWACNSLKSSPWARQAYDQARARNLPHHRALRGLGARWMRVLWRARTDGVPYDEARHLKLTAGLPVTDPTGDTDFPRAHSQKIWSTNSLERLNREVKRRTDVVGIFPDPAALLRLSACVLIEAHDEWQDSDRRYLSEESMALLNPPAPTVLEPKASSPTKTTRRAIAATA